MVHYIRFFLPTKTFFSLADTEEVDQSGHVGRSIWPEAERGF